MSVISAVCPDLVRIWVPMVLLTFCAVALAGSSRPNGCSSPVVLLQETPVGIVMMPGGGFAFYNVRDPKADVSLPTTNGLRVKLEPKIDFILPTNVRVRSPLLLGRDGELHSVFTKRRGEGRRHGVDRFIDLWHCKTTGKLARWEEPRMIWEGYTGALMGYWQLRSGRILVPFARWVPGCPMGPPVGCNAVIAVYSDDDGETWHKSNSELTAPCYEGFNGSNYGACEPSVVQLKDGRVYMLMRTQTGFLYESWSDDGAEWSQVVASRFHSSSSPPGLLRLGDGRIVLFWNNCEKPPRFQGQGVYGGRDALHAAISDDEGRTWRGFREVYGDVYRNETPPKRGDRGTAYPFGAYTKDGKILLLSGQGRGRRNFVLIDPEWLTSTRREDDFSHGLDGWHVFKSFGPAVHWWRDRTVGPVLVEHPTQRGAKVLHIRRPDDKDPDGATWNFPLGWKGKLVLSLMLQEGFAGGSIALTDRLFDPCDDNGERMAMFTVVIHADGRLGNGPKLTTGRWYELEFAWDLSARNCNVLVEAGARNRKRHLLPAIAIHGRSPRQGRVPG